MSAQLKASILPDSVLFSVCDDLCPEVVDVLRVGLHEGLNVMQLGCLLNLIENSLEEVSLPFV